MTARQEEWTGLEIAVIGMAGRFPGAPDLDAFWALLKEGREGLSFFSTETLIAQGRSRSDVEDENFVAAHGVVSDYDSFDPEFFGYTAREAALIDPQQRLFLEIAAAALDHAGYGQPLLDKSVGVFGGVSANTYLHDNILPHFDNGDTAGVFQANYSNQADFAASRVSYKLGLTGPSLTVQTACSTSLVAVHLACQSLLTGGCDMALAGGASITPPHKWGYVCQDGMIFSPDGHCRTFSLDAGGTLKGDGAGIVVLKRLADALDDGDAIDAVILSSAVNNDGEAKAGYTAPGFEGQSAVIRDAHSLSGVSSETIGYIEAHGTATPLGDPLEVSALAAAFAETTARTQFAAIGSVKTNIGHLDAAAGIAGLIKTILCLKHKQVPPSLNFKAPNPQIDFANSPVFVNDALRDWPETQDALRAAVSSFGIGGTNAHVVLERAPEVAAAEETEGEAVIIPLSAKTSSALNAAKEQLAAYLAREDAASLKDVARTLQGGRRSHNYRSAFAAKDKAEALAVLQDQNSDKLTEHVAPAGVPSVVFMFPGQGAQYVGMARGLYENDKTFREALETCFRLVEQRAGVLLRDVLFPHREDETTAVRLERTEYAQPALFSVGYALAEMWRARGLRPAALIGHSIGEITAATVSGVFSLEDGIDLVALRGRLMQSMPAGDMLAAPISVEQAAPFLSQGVSVAAVNADDRIVLSGAAEGIAKAREGIEGSLSVPCTLLKTSHAFHSAMMAPVVETFEKAVAAKQTDRLLIPVASTVSGAWLRNEDAAQAAHWGRNISAPVQFAKAAALLKDIEAPVFLEAGPGATLGGFIRRSEGPSAAIVSSLRHPKADEEDMVFTKQAFANLWTHGVPVALGAQEGRLAHVPGYPFQRKRCWMDPVEPNRAGSSTEHLLHNPSWRRDARLPARLNIEGERLCILFTDEKTANLAKALQKTAEGALCFGPSLYCDGDWASPVDFDSPENMESLLSGHQSTVGIETIVFLYGASQDAADQQGETPEAFRRAAALSTALARVGDMKGVRLICAASHSCDIVDAARLDPWARAARAMLTVAAQETAGLAVSLVDHGDDIEAVLAEISVNTSSSLRTVAYLNRWRWLQHFEPVAFEGKSEVEGVFVITGGAGAMGRALAEALVTRGCSNVALIGRRPAHSIADLGEGVTYYQADVTRFEEMSDVLAAIASDLGPVKGVVHGAGRVGADAICPLSDATEDEMHSIMSAKIEGAKVIARLCGSNGPHNPDHIILSSSLASFLGGLGTGPYSAANAWLDGYAQRKGGVWKAIDWDSWTFGEDRLQTNALAKKNGVTAFFAALQANAPQLAVSRSDVDTKIDAPATIASKPERQQGEELRSENVAAAPQSETERTLASLWRDLLGLDEIGVHDNFFELGGDSVVCIQLVSKAKPYGLVFTPDQVFEHQTVAALARVIDASKPDLTPQGAPTTDKNEAFALSGLDAGELAQLQTLLKDKE